jgi:hypothetical protein
MQLAHHGASIAEVIDLMVVNLVRCQATDAEGYRCVLVPQHEGPHKWGRCDATDAEGYRCILPPSHPGDHEWAWFARPTAAGAAHVIRYRGQPERASARAQRDIETLAAHYWFPISQKYVPSAWAARVPPLAFLFAGELVVEYEFRPPT